MGSLSYVDMNYMIFKKVYITHSNSTIEKVKKKLANSIRFELGLFFVLYIYSRI